MCGFLEDDDKVYMILDYMSNGDLSKLIKNSKPVPKQLSARVCYQMAGALIYLHSKGIIHRDVKPANILLSDSFHIRIADFGLSASDPTGVRSTECGTIFYMAPELFAVQPKYNATVDNWSLGVVMFELMTKTRPFQGQTRKQIEKAIISGYSRIPIDFHDDALNLIKRLLVMNPNNRTPLSVLVNHAFFRQPTKGDETTSEGNVRKNKETEGAPTADLTQEDKDKLKQAMKEPGMALKEHEEESEESKVKSEFTTFDQVAVDNAGNPSTENNDSETRDTKPKEGPMKAGRHTSVKAQTNERVKKDMKATGMAVKKHEEKPDESFDVAQVAVDNGNPSTENNDSEEKVKEVPKETEYNDDNGQMKDKLKAKKGTGFVFKRMWNALTRK